MERVDFGRCHLCITPHISMHGRTCIHKSHFTSFSPLSLLIFDRGYPHTHITISIYFKLLQEHLHPSSKFQRIIRASKRISSKNHFQLHRSGKILKTCLPSTLNHSSYNLKFFIILHTTLQIRGLFKELVRAKNNTIFFHFYFKTEDN